MHISRIISLLVLTATLACSDQNSTQEDVMFKDPHSGAAPATARVTHLSWEAKVLFETQQIEATASWTIEKKADATEMYFDSRGLEIYSVSLDNGSSTNFVLDERDNPWMGDLLTIAIDPSTTRVNIHYITAPTAAAVQWLEARQTLDKKGPFMFTQSQAILARSWIPCQDSPGIRFTYDARVEVPKGMLALMSAENPRTVSADGIYTFRQPHPIPAYLMALSVGYMDFKAIDKRSGVYAESGLLEKSRLEFQELPAMIDAAEKLYGPYAWGRYDVLVLPPSFPFGGMENPMLTFATPTILAGDRSLTSLIAHELAHSWSGNLVTNADWNDFWLNEGFTVYFERRIMEAIQGPDYAEMLASLGFQDMEGTIQTFGASSAATQLKLNLAESDPDDGMNDIAYEKGYSLLRLIENEVGRDRMDAFLRAYFKKFAFRSMTTERFIEYLKKRLLDEATYQKLNIDSWIYAPGLPENVIRPVPTRFLAVDKALKTWVEDGKLENRIYKKWSSHEWLHFIRQLPDKLTATQMTSLDHQFGFTNSGNSEILAAWFIHAIRNDYIAAYPRIHTFLESVGRRKFIVPIYQALLDNPNTREMARKIYREYRPNYHSVATQTLDTMIIL